MFGFISWNGRVCHFPRASAKSQCKPVTSALAVRDTPGVVVGQADAIRSIFPDTVIQTCVVHVIRNAMRFVSYKDRRKIASSMRAGPRCHIPLEEHLPATPLSECHNPRGMIRPTQRST